MKKITFLDIPPLNAVSGRLVLPGSKSISNRALLLGALSDRQTQLTGLLDSDDTRAMLSALEDLGCIIEMSNPGDIAQGVSITGCGTSRILRQNKTSTTLFLGNAGTVMRPLAAVTALLGGHYVLDGVERMRERPIGDLVQALQDLGCQINYLGTPGFPPLEIKPPRFIEMRLSQPIRVKADVSSQFLSALLMALPLVAQQQAICIEIVGELISQPYVAITLRMMADFGVHVIQDEWQRFTIPAGSRYISPGHYLIEKDASSASYFIAAAAIAARPEHPLVIEGLGRDSIQGDIRFIDAARSMGAQIDADAYTLRVARGQFPLKAIELDCNHIPDAAMTLAVMALYAQGTTRLTNIASWRVKETDRLQAMQTELTRLGAQVQTDAQSITITPPATFKAASVHTYDDHRMAMCFSLAAFNPQHKPVCILDPACVNKTYPSYFEDFFRLVQGEFENIPVITIDGPSASGKGTLASLLAQTLGYHYLDSGALYRITAYAAKREGIAGDDISHLVKLAQDLPVAFSQDVVLYQDEDITQAIRAEDVGMLASQIAVHAPVRAALLALQHRFRQLPGLVTDGRDMGSVVFPDAQLKVFLTASVEARAQRRYKQLKEKGISAKIEGLLADLQARDARDMSRAAAPLEAARGAYLLDNSELDVLHSVQQVLSWWEEKRPFR